MGLLQGLQGFEKMLSVVEALVWRLSYSSAEALLNRLLASRAGEARPPRLEEASLYIHVPFCRRPCRFCCFVRFPAEGRDIRGYYRCLRRELETVLVETEARVSHVHVGGGTPAILPDELLALVDTLRGYQRGFTLTVELHPKDLLSEEGLAAIRELRADRLSVGLQSTSDEMLRRLGRLSHTAEEGLAAAKICSGLARTVNVDLVWGVPGQSVEDALLDLRRVVEETGVNQVTLYPLLAPTRIRHPRAFEMYKALMREARRLGWHPVTPWTIVKRGGLTIEYIYEDEPRFIGVGLSSLTVAQGVMYANTFNLERYEKLACSGRWTAVAATKMRPHEWVGFALMNWGETSIAAYMCTALGHRPLEPTAILTGYLAGEARRAVYAALALFRKRALAAL